MKYVLKTLLFINLVLQMTSALRKCFDQDQNLMLTIILLAFSIIGIIGLIIGNRFILIIFAACMALIFIASIVIYAYGRSESDSLQPKVPYYINSPMDSTNSGDKGSSDSGHNKLKSLVNKWLNRNQQPEAGKGNKGNRKQNKTRLGFNPNQRNSRRSMNRKLSINSSSSVPILPLISPSMLDDYPDESAPNFVNLQLLPTNLPIARSSLPAVVDGRTSGILKTLDGSIDMVNEVNISGQQPSGKLFEKKTLDDIDEEDVNQVQNEQWIVYERYIYEKYLDMVSQSIDLILHTILASWMALLLDEDSDQCFGTKSSKHKTARGPGHPAPEAPTYNYNGVRYSIRPDMNDSPARVVVR